MHGPSNKETLSVTSSYNAYFLGVDGGATKTVAMVSDTKGHKISFGYGGPSNRDSVGPKKATSSVKKSIDEALSKLELSYNDITCGVFALAGIHTDEDRQWFRKQFNYINPPLDLFIQNDVVAAWAAGTLCKPGIAVISGTGSNAFGVNLIGQTWKAGVGGI